MNNALRKTPLFGGLSDASLSELYQYLETRDVFPGAYVIREGDSSHEMYLLLDGRLEVLKESLEGGPVSIAELVQGDCFGEMSIIDVLPRSASVIALAPSRLLTISRRNLHDHLFVPYPADYAMLMMNIARELSRRLRSLDLDRASLRKAYGFRTVHSSR